MDFIFMLTRQDRTISDCLEFFALIRPLRLRHIGFKDVGVDAATLAALAAAVHESGAATYMEVVNTAPEACLNSARIAANLGVDNLLGGTDVAGVQAILAGSQTRYFPFSGFPTGHPTKLGGKPEDIEAHCRDFILQGCAGADLLAYRATESDPLDLVRAARRGLGKGRLIVAGSVSTVAQIMALSATGADAFTIGSAVFDGSYAPDKGSVLSQLRAIEADCAAATAK